MSVDKINNLDRIRINGKLYEWNHTFGGYWTVLGNAYELQEKDIVGINLEDVKLAQFNEDD